MSHGAGLLVSLSNIVSDWLENQLRMSGDLPTVNTQSIRRICGMVKGLSPNSSLAREILLVTHLALTPPPPEALLEFLSLFNCVRKRDIVGES